MSYRPVEQENDRMVAEELQGKVSLIKSFTVNIHNEVDSQNRLLDDMSTNMSSANASLTGTLKRVRIMIAQPQNRQLAYAAAGCILFVFVVFLWRR